MRAPCAIVTRSRGREQQGATTHALDGSSARCSHAHATLQGGRRERGRGAQASLRKLSYRYSLSGRGCRHASSPRAFSLGCPGSAAAPGSARAARETDGGVDSSRLGLGAQREENENLYTKLRDCLRKGALQLNRNARLRYRSQRIRISTTMNAAAMSLFRACGHPDPASASAILADSVPAQSVNVAAALLRSHPKAAAARDACGRNPLMWAARNSAAAIVAC